MINVSRYFCFEYVPTSHLTMFLLAFHCVFGLLLNRLKGTHHLIFHELKSVAIQVQLNFVPKAIITDFEPGLIV